MAGNTVVVSITGNAKGLQNALGDSTSALSKFGKVAGAVALAAAAAVGVMSVKAVKSASTLEQSMGAMGAVFKDSTGQMTAWAKGASQSLGLAQSDYAQLAAVLGSQLKNLGVSTDALAGQTNDLIGVGADLAAQFGGSTSDAVSALSALLRGERDPIEQYGVSIKQADIEARKAAMGLDGLSGEAAKNADLTATLALLYEQTASAQGAFSRESDTLAGAQQRLAAKIENTWSTIGTALLPAVTAVTSAFGTLVDEMSESKAFADFTQNVTNASNKFADFIYGLLSGEKSLKDYNIGGWLKEQFQNLGDWIASGGIQQLFAGLAEGREHLMNSMLQALPGIVDAIVKFVPPFITALVTFLAEGIKLIVGAAPQILQAALTLFQGLITALVTLLPDLITTIIGMLPSIIDAAFQLFTGLIQGLAQVLPQLLVALSELLPQIVVQIMTLMPEIAVQATLLWLTIVQAFHEVLPVLLQAVADLLPNLVEEFTAMLPTMMQTGIDLFEKLVDAFVEVLPGLLLAVVSSTPKIVGAILSIQPQLLVAGIQLFEQLVKSIPIIVPKARQALQDMGPELRAAVASMVPILLQAGVDLIGGLVQGLRNSAYKVGSALLSIAKNALGDFLSFFGIHSPSTLMAEKGVNLVQGLVGGVKKSTRLAVQSFRGLSSAVEGAFNPNLSATASLSTDATNGSVRLSDDSVKSITAAVTAANEDTVAYVSNDSVDQFAERVAAAITAAWRAAQREDARDARMASRQGGLVLGY